MANIYAMSDTWNDAGTAFTAIKMNVTDTASDASSLLMDLQVGGSSTVAITKNGRIKMGFYETLYLSSNRVTFANSAYVSTSSDFRVGKGSSGSIGFGNNPDGQADRLVLKSLAQDSFDQVRSTNAQTFNLYNTYTDASNYERGFMKWNSNVLEIGTEAAGTGVERAVQLNAHNDNTKTLVFNNNNIGRNGKLYLRANPGADQYFWFQNDQTQLIMQGNQINIGSNSGVHFRMDASTARACFGKNVSFPLSGASYQFRSIATTDVAFAVQGIASQTGDLQQWVDSNDNVLASVLAGGSIQIAETTAPSAPSADAVRIYAEDNGSGKTRLMALFPTGVAQQIAIEP